MAEKLNSIGRSGCMQRAMTILESLVRKWKVPIAFLLHCLLPINHGDSKGEAGSA